MFSNYRLDDKSVDIMARALFTRLDKDNNNSLSTSEVKNLLENLYSAIGDNREISETDALKFIMYNGGDNNCLSLQKFKDLVRNIIGCNKPEHIGYDLIKKDVDVLNVKEALKQKEGDRVNYDK